MRYASVCSGVEAASLAWMPLGWRPVWFSEIEPFPCAVLKERFPSVQNLGDMTKIDGKRYAGTVDLLVGGTPCQGFSVAGKQGGLDDPRSALCLAYCRLLETMRPRWFVWENVPGVFSTNGGEDFRAFLRKIDEIGYSCAWRVLDAQYVRVDGFPRAVPQRRRRVFVVGCIGDWRRPASVLFEPCYLPGDTPPRRVKGEGVARSLTASTGGPSGEDVSTTLTEAFADDRMPDKGKLPCVICRASNMTNAETGVNVGTTLLASQYKSPPFVCVHETGQGYWQDGDIAGALTARHDSSPCVDRGANIVCGYETGPGYWQGGDISGTLRAEGENRPSRPSNILIDQSVKRIVRRLTPVECERLMGFPDNWTRIPWRGKPEEQCPDGPRYKACGNSMCVNVMRWIGMRIEYIERKINIKVGEE